jgi:hypothetical protein
MSQIETQHTARGPLSFAATRGIAIAYRPRKGHRLHRAWGASFKMLQATRLSQPVKIPQAGNHNTEDILGGV